MAFSREQFVRLRPYLYHLTNPTNLPMLRRERSLRSAAWWAGAAHRFAPQLEDPEAFLAAPRLRPVTLRVGRGRRVTLNDQFPMRSRRSFASLRGTYEDYLRCLNALVFWWPGDGERLKSKGSLAETFALRNARAGWLRIPTADAWGEAAPVRFCRYNSGAPQARDGVERGPHIFVTCDEPGLTVGGVAEVVFEHGLALPATAEWRDPGGQKWRPLLGGR
jgi:hypothetical protein